MKKILAAGLVSVFPLLAFAQYTPSQGIVGLIKFFSTILGYLFPVLIALAVIFFVWKVFQYTISSDEDGKKAAKGGIVYGIVGIFIMVSVWGLVGILQSTFGTQGVSVDIGRPIPVIQ